MNGSGPRRPGGEVDHDPPSVRDATRCGLAEHVEAEHLRTEGDRCPLPVVTGRPARDPRPVEPEIAREPDAQRRAPVREVGGRRVRRTSGDELGAGMGLGLLPKARPPSVIDLGADAGDTEPERDEDAETELDGQGPAFVGADQRRDDDRREPKTTVMAARRIVDGRTARRCQNLTSGGTVTVRTVSSNCGPSSMRRVRPRHPVPTTTPELPAHGR